MEANFVSAVSSLANEYNSFEFLCAYSEAGDMLIKEDYITRKTKGTLSWIEHKTS